MAKSFQARSFDKSLKTFYIETEFSEVDDTSRH